MHRSGVDQWSLIEFAVIPKLKPFEIVRAFLDVVVHAVVLEEELLVTPQR